MRVTILAAAIAALAGCTLLTSFDGLSTGVTGVADASSPDGDGPLGPDAGDAASAGDAGDAASAGDAGDVVLEDHFDMGCGPGWLAKDSILSVEPAGRSGQACMVCASGTRSKFFAEKELAGVTAGDKYKLVLYIRRLTAGPNEWEAAIESELPGTNPGDRENGSFEQGWKKVEVEHVLVKDLTSLVVAAGSGSAAAGDCVAIDDLVLRRVAN